MQMFRLLRGVLSARVTTRRRMFDHFKYNAAASSAAAAGAATTAAPATTPGGNSTPIKREATASPASSASKRPRKAVVDVKVEAGEAKVDAAEVKSAVACALTVAPKVESALVVHPESLPPYIAGAVSPYRDRFAACCVPCFQARVPCPHYKERRLRLLLIGHNPSDHAWMTGFPYSNPSNNMRKLLTGTLSASCVYQGLVPPEWQLLDMNTVPDTHGIGVIDLGVEPGNDANAYGVKVMHAWRQNLFARIRGHVERVAASSGLSFSEAAPPLVAFTGKRQWSYLFEPPLTRIDSGPTSAHPPGWPLPPTTQVWVLPSSSGRAAMTTEARAGPYRSLAARMREFPWTPKGPDAT